MMSFPLCLIFFLVYKKEKTLNIKQKQKQNQTNNRKDFIKTKTNKKKNK